VTASLQRQIKETAKQALVIFSDGLDNRSKVPLTGAIAAAQQAEVLVFGIRLFGHKIEEDEGVGDAYRRALQLEMADELRHQQEAGRFIMRRMSEKTGGSYFEGSGGNFTLIFARIEEELPSQCRFAFVPKSNAGQPRFRKITVTVKDPSLTVQTRAGYYLISSRSVR
jgi:VWFA-related protein